jgi:hypothetical protein
VRYRADTGGRPVYALPERGPMVDAIDGERLYVAGHAAPPGRYQRVDAPAGRTIVLDQPDVLPASLDGRVAVYARLATPPRAASTAERTPHRKPLVGPD